MGQLFLSQRVESERPKVTLASLRGSCQVETCQLRNWLSTKNRGDVVQRLGIQLSVGTSKQLGPNTRLDVMRATGTEVLLRKLEHPVICCLKPKAASGDGCSLLSLDRTMIMGI